LVEDEALLAAETAADLEDAGHVVTATAVSLEEAKQAAADADVDIAVLDVNLGGELSFAAADLLLTRGIPFVFVTGYEPDGLIPRRFSTAPVLRKPSPPGALRRALSEALAPAISQRDHDLRAS
jgi:CheY-like chemotaxis protein